MSTTDTFTLVIERCCKSTIPFILDDPKSIKGIGETLISQQTTLLMSPVQESKTPITPRKRQRDDISSEEDYPAGVSTSQPRGAGSKRSRGRGQA